MASTNNLDKAMDFMLKAVNEDEQRNWPEAYKLYKNALDYFMLTVKFEKDEKLKQLVIIKIRELVTRAETLKRYMEAQRELGKSAVGVNGTSDGAVAGTGKSMASTNALDKAIELVAKAIDEDKQHNYPEAYKLYQNVLDYFMLALKYEKNEKLKQQIKAKINEYLTRAETLKQFIETQRKEKFKNAVRGGDGSDGPVADTGKSKEGGDGDGKDGDGDGKDGDGDGKDDCGDGKDSDTYSDGKD